MGFGRLFSVRRFSGHSHAAVVHTLVCVEEITGQRQKMSCPTSQRVPLGRHDVWPVLSLDLYGCEDMGMVVVMAAMLIAAEVATSGKVGVKASSPNEWARLIWSA